MQKIALAAFLLGVFSLSPLAKAEDAGESAVMTNGSSMSNTTTVAKKGDRLPTSDFVPERHPAAAPVLQSTAAGPAGDDASSDDDVSNIPAATRDGMKWNEIKNVSSSFKVTIDGDSLVFSGNIPRRCAKNAYAGEFDAQTFPGQIGIKLDMPECRPYVRKNGDNDRVPVQARFAMKSLPSQNGKLCLLWSENSDAPQCDPLLVDGKQLEYKTQASILADAQAKKSHDDAVAELKKRDREDPALVEKLRSLCVKGEFGTFADELRAAQSALGDVVAFLARIPDLKVDFLRRSISDAKTIDDVKDRYEKFQREAPNSSDADKVAKAAADRALALATESSKKGSKASLEARADLIHDAASFIKDLDDLNDDDRQEMTNKIGIAFFNLANKAREEAGTDADKLADAEHLYRTSEEYVDNAASRAKLEAEIAKMYDSAADQCLKDAGENPKAFAGKDFAACDKLKARELNAMNAAIKQQSHLKTDGSLEALMGMKNEKIYRFGYDGSTVNYGNVGQVNLRGGTYDMTKAQMWTQSRNNFVRDYMLQQQGMQPMNGAASATSGGGIFLH